MNVVVHERVDDSIIIYVQYSWLYTKYYRNYIVWSSGLNIMYLCVSMLVSKHKRLRHDNMTILDVLLCVTGTFQDLKTRYTMQWTHTHTLGLRKITFRWRSLTETNWEWKTNFSSFSVSLTVLLHRRFVKPLWWV